MAYCRIGDGDLYVFLNVGGWLECCGCSLGEGWEHESTQEMISHIHRHIDAGHAVPNYLISDLMIDMKMNDEYMANKRKERNID